MKRYLKLRLIQMANPLKLTITTWDAKRSAPEHFLTAGASDR